MWWNWSMYPSPYGTFLENGEIKCLKNMRSINWTCYFCPKRMGPVNSNTTHRTRFLQVQWVGPADGVGPTAYVIHRPTKKGCSSSPLAGATTSVSVPPPTRCGGATVRATPMLVSSAASEFYSVVLSSDQRYRAFTYVKTTKLLSQTLRAIKRSVFGKNKDDYPLCRQ